MAIAPETHDETLASLLNKLRQAASAKPVHADRLEALIKYYADGGDPYSSPDLAAVAGLTARVATMLDDDVSHLFWWRALPERRQRQPLQYPRHMVVQARLAAGRRQREEEKRNPLNIDLGG